MMFKGKTTWVTGSTSGIGCGIGIALAQEGANVILNGFGDVADIEIMRAQMANDYGVVVRYDGADLPNQAQIEAMMAKALAEFTCVDILVNHAGTQFVAPIDEFPVEKWNAILAINLTVTFHTVRLALPAMKAKGWDEVRLAEASGVDRSLIGRYLRGEVEVGAKNGVRLAKALEVHLEDILGKKYAA